MSSNIKALIVVVGIGAAVLWLAKPIALRFSSAADYHRRSALWFVLTIAAFLSPNFWWFVLLAAPLLLWGTFADSHPVALYLFLLQVVPSIFVSIPVIGINKLFDLDIGRLMSICILIPAIWRLRGAGPAAGARGFELADLLLLGYGVLQTAIFVKPDVATLGSHVVLSDSLTNALRRAFLYFLDVYVIYYAVRRYCTTPRAIAEALAALCLCCAITAPIAIFESLRHWLLYNGIAADWSQDPALRVYLMRDHVLRAQAASGDPLALGYLLAIGCGVSLYLWQHADATARKCAAVLALWLGLLAAYSRGPWLGAVAIYLTYAAVTPQRLSSLLKTGGILFAAAVALLLSPFGGKIMAVLPFFGGTVDSSNYLYRRALVSESWQLIRQHPWFGDPNAYTQLADLRQGQGIIDLVNSYLQVVLFYGLVGLALFVGVILVPLKRTYRVARSYAHSDPDLARLGAALVACIVGTLLMLADCSFLFTYAKLYFVLAGLGVAYARFGALHQLVAASTASVPTTAQPMPAPQPAYRLRPARWG
jgi:O-antigen ligase